MSSFNDDEDERARPWVNKTFVILNSTEHEIYPEQDKYNTSET